MSGVSIHCHQFPLNLETNVQIHLQQKVTSYIKTRIIYIHSEKNRHFRFVLDMKKSSFFGWLKIPGVPVASRSPSNSTNLDPGWPQVKSGDSKCMETSKCLWCLKVLFIFTPNPGETIQFDYFSNGWAETTN